MSTIEFLSYLRTLDIQIWSEDGKVRLNAPKGVLTDDLRRAIAGRKAEILEFLSQAEEAISAPSTITPVARGGQLPLSFAQQQMWILHQLNPDDTSYTLPFALGIHGPLDTAILHQSFDELVRRHESLRTTFVLSGEMVEQIIAAPVSLTVASIDLEALPRSEQDIKVQHLVREEVRRPFDLSRGPLLRVMLLRLSPVEHVVALNIHHIIYDAWSFGIFARELMELYQAFAAGNPSPLLDCSIQYADFAVWQQQWLHSPALDTQLAYWKQHLAGAPALLSLPTDRPRPPVQGFNGARYSRDAPQSLLVALKMLSQREGATLFMTLLTAVEALFVRYTGQEDIVVGSPISGRELVELEGLIGCFVNTLALRSDLRGNPTFRTALQRVRQVCLEAYAYQAVPFEKLVEALQVKRDLSYPPLIQIMVALQNAPATTLELPGLTLNVLDVEMDVAKLDLTINFIETSRGLRTIFEYNTDLFDQATIARLAEHLQILVEDAVAQPDTRLSDLALVSEAEVRQLRSWNDTVAPIPDACCIHQLFEAQAALHPEAVAVVSNDSQLTYQELDRQANQLARTLQELGVRRGSLIAVYMDRSLEMIVAVMGILKAGGAYVPFEPSFPDARVNLIMATLAIQHVITQQPYLQAIVRLRPPSLKEVICLDPPQCGVAQIVEVELPNQDALSLRIWTHADVARRAVEPVSSSVNKDDLAYIIFTSGSTGQPKGVMVQHYPVVNLIDWINTQFEIGASDRVLFVTSLCFDLSVYDIFGLLAAGGSIQLVSSDDLGDAERLMFLLCDERITLWDSAPAALQQLVPFFAASRLPSTQSTVRRVFLSGDWIPISLPDLFRKSFPSSEVISLGGATEATVWSNYYPIGEVASHWTSIPYGKPIRNAQYYILDRHLNLCPIGVPGDLYIAGECLALGYANDPVLTAQKFIPHPFSELPGARMYKTGDLTRYWSDGNMEFLGRADQQVKLRGFRIELGEIQAVLAQHPDVREAVVLVREDVPGNKQLVAYIVHTQTGDETGQPTHRNREREAWTTQLQSYLKTHLPDYMIPSMFVFLKTWPVTSNGKLDRKALPAPDIEYLKDSYVAPQTATEERLAQIWAQVLMIDQVGIHDDFFALGGHSLLALQIVSRLRDQFKISLVPRQLFEAPTVAQLAQVIHRHQCGDVISVDQESRPLDLKAEAVLDPTITVTDQTCTFTASPIAVFLTGATGFLGAFLLHELLQQTTASVYCLIRASDPEQGRQRLQAHLSAYQLWNAADSDRIMPVIGDLGQPRLGLSPEGFAELAAKVDAIYHAGALVNFVYPYSVMKAPNVLGTQEVLRMAVHSKVKPVHFVSTTSVFYSYAYAQDGFGREDDPLDHYVGLSGGYPQSKWVAEKLVMSARSRGVPVYIYRPGRITWHSETGVWNRSDLLYSVIKACMQLGYAPIVERELMLTPVDFVSKAIVQISRQEHLTGKAFHLLSPYPTSWQMIVDWIRNSGYPLQQCAYDDWFAMMKAATGSAFHPLTSIEEGADINVAHIHFDTRQTLDALEGTATRYPYPDEALFRPFLRYLLHHDLRDLKEPGSVPGPSSLPITADPGPLSLIQPIDSTADFE